MPDVYGLKIEETDDKGNSLALSIAEDLREDKHSSIAPILQIQLSEMWNKVKSRPKGKRVFSYELYKTIKNEGAESLEQFFDQQLENIEKESVGKLKQYIKNGLHLDLLMFHTTDMGTANQQTIKDIQREYLGGNAEELRYLNLGKRISKKGINDLLNKLIQAKLLFKLPHQKIDTYKLSHDTLAPYVIKKWSYSNFSGQQAARLLRSKTPVVETAKNSTSFFLFKGKAEALAGFKNLGGRIQDAANAKADDSDPNYLEAANLTLIRNGSVGMRKWNQEERKLLEYNNNLQKKIVRKKQRGRLLGIALGITVAGLIFWTMRNVVGKSEQERLLNSYKYLALADDEIEKDRWEKALNYTTQAYAYHFPHPAAHINRQLMELAAEKEKGRAVMKKIATLEPSGDKLVFSPNGQYYLQYSSEKASLIEIRNRDQSFSLPIKTGFKIQAIDFSYDGNRLALSLHKDSQKPENEVQIYHLGDSISYLAKRSPNNRWVPFLDIAPKQPILALGTRDTSVLLWNYQTDKIDTLRNKDHLYKKNLVNKGLYFGPEGKSLLVRTFVQETDNDHEFFWRYNGEEWIVEAIALHYKFHDYHQPTKKFLESNFQEVFLWDYSKGKPQKRLTEIRLPGMEIETCHFTKDGHILVLNEKGIAWLFDQSGTPLDIFEFTHPIKHIQPIAGTASLYFYTEDGSLYQSNLGKSISLWTEETFLDSSHDQLPAPRLDFQTEVLTWYQSLNGLFAGIGTLMILAFFNFMAHFYFSRDAWENWMNGLNRLFNREEVDSSFGELFVDGIADYTSIITLALYTLIFFLLTKDSPNKMELIGMLGMMGGFSALFNIRIMWKKIPAAEISEFLFLDGFVSGLGCDFWTSGL